MDVIDVIPHLTDRDAAMRLLKSCPGPIKAHVNRPLQTGAGYRFTIEDIAELIEAKRGDLAELILTWTSEVNVLYAASRMDVSVPILKAVCRNANTPGDLLVHLYNDERKGVVAAARSALAAHLGVLVRTADPVIDILRQVINCPDEDLAASLAQGYAIGWNVRGMDYATGCALDRPGEISSEAWSVVVGTDWRWIASFGSAWALKKVVRHPRATVEDLETILSKMRFRGSRNVVAEALLDKLEPGSDRWLELLTELAHSPNTGKKWAVQLAKEQAQALLAEGGVESYIALESGQLTDEEISSWAKTWSLNPSWNSSGTLKLLSHPAVRGDVLKTCLAASQAMSSARVLLAANPSLTPAMQEELARESNVTAVLAANKGLSERGATALVQNVLGTVPGYSTGRANYIPWVAQGVLLALLGNDALSDDARMNIPAIALMKPRYSTEATLPAVVAFLDRKLGHSPDSWKAFLDLLPEWEGNLGELVTALEVL